MSTNDADLTIDRQRLVKFISDLADPRRLAEFTNDPEGAMRAASLSDDEIAIINSRDAEVIRRALGDGVNAAYVHVSSSSSLIPPPSGSGDAEEHEVIIYEAAQLSLCAPRIDRLPLRDLADAPAVPVSTLYVPPLMER